MSWRAQRSAPGPRSCLLSLEPLEERELLSGAALSQDLPAPSPPAPAATTGLTGQPSPTSPTTPDTGSTDADASEYQGTSPDQTSPALAAGASNEAAPAAAGTSATTRAANPGQGTVRGTLSPASTYPAPASSALASPLLAAQYAPLPVLLHTAAVPPLASVGSAGPEPAGVAALPAAPFLVEVTGPLPPSNAAMAGAVSTPSPLQEPAAGESASPLPPPIEVALEQHLAPTLPTPVDRVLPSALAGLTPQGAPLLAGLLPLDLVPLARSADQFFAHLEELADSGSFWRPTHLATWLAAGVVTTAAYECARCLRRRPPLDLGVEGVSHRLTRTGSPGPSPPPGNKP